MKKFAPVCCDGIGNLTFNQVSLGRAGSIPVRSTSKQEAKWWNRYTRDTQNVVPKGMRVRISLWPLIEKRVGNSNAIADELGLSWLS